MLLITRRISPGASSLYLSVAILAIFIIISAFFIPSFFASVNLANIVRLYAPSGIIAIGLSMVLLSGEIDVSVGSIASVSVMTATRFIDVNQVLAISIALIVGVVCGLLNGLIVTKLRVPSLIVTIATLSVFGGMASIIGPQSLLLKDNYPVYSTPVNANIIGVPLSFLLCLLIAVVLWWTTAHTSFGRQVYFTGSNRRAAWMSGVPTDRVRIITFVISGFCAALAGYLLSAQVGVLVNYIGRGQELTAITIAVLSGVSLFGGRGSIAAVLIGTLTLGVFINMLALFRLGSHFSLVMQGVLLLIILLLFGIISRQTTKGES